MGWNDNFTFGRKSGQKIPLHTKKERAELRKGPCPNCGRRKNKQSLVCRACSNIQGMNQLQQRVHNWDSRPGCLLRDGLAWVCDVAAERWVAHEIQECRICGIDQHLDECLDCTAPIGMGKKDASKRIRPMKKCVDCGAWDPFTPRCGPCLLKANAAVSHSPACPS